MKLRVGTVTEAFVTYSLIIKGEYFCHGSLALLRQRVFRMEQYWKFLSETVKEILI